MIELNVNGRVERIEADPDTPLLYVLREDLRLNAAKFGCGLAQCGACTVLVDGAAVLACVVPIQVLSGRRITTLEGLGGAGHPSPLQQAFIDEQAAQCGYCIAGMIMRAQALLLTDPAPSDEVIRAWLEPNLCRCGTHLRILRAVRRAAESRPGSGAATSPPGSLGAAPPDPRAPAHPKERERPER
jgi:nicotinate dehydrogenase subunit A